MCSLFKCKEEAVDFWGEQAQYILLRCSRCNKEKIVCCFEGKKLNHDSNGLKILDKMMKDHEFSLACHIHQQFKEIEEKYPFNFNKRELEFDKLKIKFNLSNIGRPADPILMYEKGLWESKSEKSKSQPAKKQKKSKRESDQIPPPINDMKIEIPNEQEESKEVNEIKDSLEIKIVDPVKVELISQSDYYTHDVKPMVYEFDKEEENKLVFSVEELKKQLEELLEREDYEQAAKIRDRINQIENL